MKLHLPVKLFKAILSLFVVAPALTLPQLQAKTITVDLQASSTNFGVQMAPYLPNLDGNEYIFRLPAYANGFDRLIYAKVSINNATTISQGLKPADTTGTGNTSWLFTNLNEAQPASISFRDMVSPHLINIVSHAGQDTYVQFDSLDSVFIESNNGAADIVNESPSEYHGSVFHMERGRLVFSNNGEVSLSHNGHYYSPAGVICNQNSQGEGEILFENNDEVSISQNLSGWQDTYLKPDGVTSPLGGAIVTSAPLIFRDNGTIEVKGNDVYDGGSGAFVCSTSTVLFSGNDSILFSGNTASSGGIVIDAPVIIFDGNGKIEFQQNLSNNTTSEDSVLGGVVARSTEELRAELRVENNDEVLVDYSCGFYTDGLMSIRNNGCVIFTVNGTNSYSAIGGTLDSTIELSSARGDAIYFGKDWGWEKLRINGTVNVNQMYGDLAQTGRTEIATGQGTTDGSWSSELGEFNVYDGELVLLDTAFTGNITVYPSQSGASTSTLWLNEGTAHKIGTIIVKAGGNLGVEEFGYTDDLVMEAGSSLTLYLNDYNKGSSGALSATFDAEGTMRFSGPITLNIAIFDDELRLVEGPELEKGERVELIDFSKADTNFSMDLIGEVNSLYGCRVTKDDLLWDEDKQALYIIYNGISSIRVSEYVWRGNSGDVWSATGGEAIWKADYGSDLVAYENGGEAVFTDAGSGEVQLVGDLAPEQVEVSSSTSYTFTGSGSIVGDAKLSKSGTGTLVIANDNSYSGGTEITGGVLQAAGTGALGTGPVSVQDATLQIAAAGFDHALSISGSSTIEVLPGQSLVLQQAIAGSGSLVLTGSIDASALEMQTSGNTRVDVDGQVTGTDQSGFDKKGEQWVVLTDPAIAVDGTGASVSYRDGGVTLQLTVGQDGRATAGGYVNYSTYYLVSAGDRVAVSEIYAAAQKGGFEGTPGMEMSNGTLVVDASTDALVAVGGTIELATEGVTLGGSITGATINLSAGAIDAAQLTGTTINASGSGTIQSAMNGGTLNVRDYCPSSPIAYTGELVVTGTFDLSSHTGLGDLVETRLDASGQEGASGFLHIKSDAVVQLFQRQEDGATLDLTGASAQYKGTQLVLSADGTATLAPTTTYTEYYLTGEDTVSVSAVNQAAAGHLGAGETPVIVMDGGVLSVDVSTERLEATGGTIELATAGVTLGGSISGSTVNLSDGTLDARELSHSTVQASGGVIASEFSGESSLIGTGDQGFALQNTPLSNSGTLTVDGTIVADALTLNREESTHINTDGASGTSGFLRAAREYVQIVENHGDSATTVAGDSLVITHQSQTDDRVLKLGSDGIAAVGGEMDYTQYFLQSEADQVTVSAVQAISQDQIGQDATIVLSAGTLVVDTSLDSLAAVGGTIEMATEGVTLGGGFLSATINLSAGTIDAVHLTDTTINASGSGIIQTTMDGGTLNVRDYCPSSPIAYTGQLVVTGTFDLSSHTGLGDLVETRLDASGQEGASGFLHIKSDAVVQLFQSQEDGATLDLTGASALYKGTQLVLGADGTATLAPTTTFTEYYLTGEDTVSVSAVNQAAAGHLGAGGTPMLVMDGGVLTVDVSTERLEATGGTIELATAGVTLGGSISGSTVNLSDGTLDASELSDSTVQASGGVIASTFSGESTLIGTGNQGFALQNTPLSNSGTLTVDGTIVADALTLNREESTHINADGESGTSGFLRAAREYVQIVENHGDSAMTVAGDSLVITHQSQTDDRVLKLGSDGIAAVGGEMDYTQYFLQSDADQAAVSAVQAISQDQIGQDATIVLSSGTLVVDASTDSLTATGGTIEMATEGVTLGGKITGATVNLSAGTIDAAQLQDATINASGSGSVLSGFSGSSILIGDDYKVVEQLHVQSGLLEMGGSIDASQLELKMTCSGIVGLNGDISGDSENVSGYAMDSKYECRLVTLEEGGNAQVSALSSLTIRHSALPGGRELALGSDGVALFEGQGVDYSTFFLRDDGVEYSVAQIAEESASHAVALAGVSMEGGVLRVDASADVSSTAGEIRLVEADDGSEVELGGFFRDTEVISQQGTSRVSADITGTSSVTVDDGVVTLSGDNSYTGATTVHAGKLVVENDSALGSGQVVLNGGELDLSSQAVKVESLQLQGGTLSNAGAYAGELVLGNQADVTLNGAYTLSGGRSLVVGEQGATLTTNDSLTLGGGRISLAGLLTVEGEVALVDGTTTLLNLGSWNNLTDGEVLMQLQADQVSENLTDGLALEGALNATLEFDADTGELKLVYVNPNQPLTTAWNLSLNQQRIVSALNAIATSQLATGELAALLQHAAGAPNEAAYKAALDALAGTEYAVLMSSQIDGNMGHLRRLRDHMGNGQPLTQDRRLRAYVGAYGDDVELDADSRGYGYDRNEYGAAFVMDYAVTDQLTLGLAFEAGSADVRPTNGRELEEEAQRVDIGAVYRKGNFISKTAIGFGLHHYDLRRSVGGMRTTASPDGASLNFLQEFAWRFNLTEKSNVQVFSAIESSYNDIDGFSESGAGTASLQACGQHAWSTDITVGARYALSFGMLGNAPEATFSCQAGVVVSVGDTTADIAMQFAGAPGVGFIQSSADRDRVGGMVGFGLDVPVSDRMTVGVGGSAIMRGDSHELNGNVGVRLTF